MARRRTQKWAFKLPRKFGITFFKLTLKFVPSGLMIGAICFIFFGVRRMLHADPYFQVERITVFPSGILAASERQFLERQTSSRSLLEVDLKEISRSLERNPKVKRAEITRSLPNQLNVFLTMRVPFIQVQLKPGGSYFSVAQDQLVLSSQDSPKPDLMILEDFNSEKKSYSVGALYQNKHFHWLFDAFESIKTNPIFSAETVSKLAMDQLGNVTLILKDGLELRAGNKLELSEGARMVLSSLLKSPERSQILYVDLRYRDIIVKKKE